MIIALALEEVLLVIGLDVFDVHISVSKVKKGNNKKSSNLPISMSKVLKLHLQTVQYTFVLK